MLPRVLAGRGGLVGVLALWVLAIWLVGPRGEFPLSDDWAYAHVVRSLLEGRGFDFLPWTGASVVFQALYGAALCKLTGFSYEALRASTLLVATLGIVSFHWMLQQLGCAPRLAAAGAAMLAFSPLWFHLSFTFMTDVPFAALAVMAAALYVRAFRSGNRLHLVQASVVAAAAFMVRQHGVWIALAAALAAMLPPRTAGTRAQRPALAGFYDRQRLLDAAAALLPTLLAAAAYTLWAMTPDAPPAVHNKISEAAGASMLSIGNAAFRGLATLGFLLWPWAVALRMRFTSERRVFGIVFGVLSAVAFFLLVREQASMFYLSNVLGDFTVGALTTRDMHFLARDLPPAGGPELHFVLTWFSLAAASALLARMSTAAAALLRLDRASAFCLLAFVLSALGSLAQAHYYFDRYLIVLVPLAIAATAALAPPPRVGVRVVIVMAVLAVYGVAGTHDYMEWNRARWSLLDGLERRGISARQIDGGFEYNAERLSAELGSAPSDAQARRGQSASLKSWWWVVDDEWIIAFGQLEGYSETESRTFRRWLPPSTGRVLLLHRDGSGPDAGSGAASQAK